MIELLLSAANVLIFGAIIYGVAKHRNAALHTKVMVACMILDFLLLAAVELTQDAIAQAVGTAEGGRTTQATVILTIHITASVLMMVWWFVQLYTGRKILKGERELLPRHARHARMFLVFRFVNLVTAFMV